MATAVSIHRSNVSKYQQIIRGAMSAAKAARELGHRDEADELMKLKCWADKKLAYEMEV